MSFRDPIEAEFWRIVFQNCVARGKSRGECAVFADGAVLLYRERATDPIYWDDNGEPTK